MFLARLLRNTETDVKRGTEETAMPQLLLMRAPGRELVNPAQGLAGSGLTGGEPEKAVSAHARVKMALNQPCELPPHAAGGVQWNISHSLARLHCLSCEVLCSHHEMISSAIFGRA